MHYLPIGNQIAIVSDEDKESVEGLNWSLLNGYAYNKFVGKMQHFLMGYGHEVIDHKDGNKLNNTRGNLRICTQRENVYNTSKWKKKTTSRFKGVAWKSKRFKWRSQIKFQGKDYHLGYYVVEKEAAEAYDEAAKKYFGEFARLNFPSTP